MRSTCDRRDYHFDIDGTPADISERIHHIKRKPKDWNAFNAGIAQDKAIRSMVRLCNLLYESRLHIVLGSGRNERNRPETVEWRNRQGVKYHALLLKSNEDYRSDAVVKRELVQGLDKSKILFVVEDRSRVLEMWRSGGLVCLQYAPG